MECLKEGIYKPGQGHHVIARTTPYMKHIGINIVPLCLEHHTGSKGIHHNAMMMLKYRQELELKLKLMFTKDYYTYAEIKELLEASDNSVKAIVKTLLRHKEGFKKSDLIMHLMGGRSYL